MAYVQVGLLVGGLTLIYVDPLWLIPGLIWFLPIIIAIELGRSRGRTGWLWGTLLGWLGVLILAIMRPRTAVDELRELEAAERLAEWNLPR